MEIWKTLNLHSRWRMLTVYSTDIIVSPKTINLRKDTIKTFGYNINIWLNLNTKSGSPYGPAAANFDVNGTYNIHKKVGRSQWIL